jgi:curved DNA-binding protein CbpA
VKFDPYEELGVPRHAPTDEIKKAHRKRAKKTHPDAGGDPEAFARTQTALSVLTDPERRRKYDETGEIGDKKVDNERAQALQMVHMHIGNMINAYVQNNFAPAYDPRNYDVVAKVRTLLSTEIRKMQEAISTGEKHIKVVERVMERFHRARPRADSVDFIVDGFKAQIANAQRQMEDIRGGIRTTTLAIDLLDQYDFRFDPPTSARDYAAGGTGGFFIRTG